MAKPKPATNPFLRGAPAPAARPQAPAALGAYPQVRLRRNRSDDWTRRLVAESRLAADDLIWPVFLHEGSGTVPVASMPGVVRYGLDSLADAVGRAADLGIPAVALFPYLEESQKTPDCAEAVNPDNLVCRAIRLLKEQVPDVGVICDVALDPFNSLGHDGLVQDGVILNDESIEILVRQALVQAESGCDVLAPSDMMDGRIGAIRVALDEAGFADRKILAYAAKYASAFYGPFRDAIGSSGALVGDKKTYQMDPANSDEALREVALDIAEGADMVMVKPGLPYLDVLQRVKETFALPTLAYSVSGEYAMLIAAAERGWIDGEKAMMELLLGFKRAGADAVLTYCAVMAAERLNEG
ncbi:MAG: porphobilinogen synthase [Kiloniellales bacterium]